MIANRFQTGGTHMVSLTLSVGSVMRKIGAFVCPTPDFGPGAVERWRLAVWSTGAHPSASDKFLRLFDLFPCLALPHPQRAEVRRPLDSQYRVGSPLSRDNISRGVSFLPGRDDSCSQGVRFLLSRDKNSRRWLHK